jgi:hypothetical protein
LYEYGGTLWEDEPFEPLPRDVKVPDLADEIDALRNIFLVNERALWVSKTVIGRLTCCFATCWRPA